MTLEFNEGLSLYISKCVEVLEKEELPEGVLLALENQLIHMNIARNKNGFNPYSTTQRIDQLIQEFRDRHKENGEKPNMTAEEFADYLANFK